MQGKQAEAVLSDLVVKCEENGVALPADPWDALDAVLTAMKSVRKHGMGRVQVDEALAWLSTKFLPAPATSGAWKKRTASSKTPAGAPDDSAVISPKAKRAKTPATPAKPKAKTTTTKKKKATMQEQVRAESAVCQENQSLVDQLAKLGEFEVLSGLTQRGTAHLRAAKQLRDAPCPVKSGAQAKQLDHVGPSAAAKIDEILTGGLESALREYTDKK